MKKKSKKNSGYIVVGVVLTSTEFVKVKASSRVKAEEIVRKLYSGDDTQSKYLKKDSDGMIEVHYIGLNGAGVSAVDECIKF